MERQIFARNALLSALEPALRSEFQNKLKIVEFDRGDVLYAQGEHLTNVYFPLRGLIGIVAETADGENMNAAFVGREGSIGLFEACGSRIFFAEAVAQVAGEAAMLSAAHYRDLFMKSENLRTVVHLYMEKSISETRQSVICTANHNVEARLCRVILQALERSGAGDVLPLTQATLAQMLGARRTTLAGTLSKLQRSGVVTSKRGAILVDDEAALEQLACSCWRVIRDTGYAIFDAPKPSCEATLVAAE